MIEDYIRKQVLPLYGNTHTTTTVTSLQTTLFRHEARYDIATTGPNLMAKFWAYDHDSPLMCQRRMPSDVEYARAEAEIGC